MSFACPVYTVLLAKQELPIEPPMPGTLTAGRVDEVKPAWCNCSWMSRLNCTMQTELTYRWCPICIKALQCGKEDESVANHSGYKTFWYVSAIDSWLKLPDGASTASGTISRTSWWVFSLSGASFDESNLQKRDPQEPVWELLKIFACGHPCVPLHQPTASLKCSGATRNHLPCTTSNPVIVTLMTHDKSWTNASSSQLFVFVLVIPPEKHHLTNLSFQQSPSPIVKSSL